MSDKQATFPSKRGFRSRSPFLQIFTFINLIETVFIQLPIRTILCLSSTQFRPHPEWPLSRSIFISLLKSNRARAFPLFSRSSAIDKKTLPKLSSKQDVTALWIQPVDEKTDLKGDLKRYFEAGGCSTSKLIAYWHGENHSGTESRTAKQGEKVYLYFHGGGYWERCALPSDPTINCLRILLKASSQSSNKLAPKRGLALEYRLTDETTFPGILADALASWKYLIEQGFESKNIIISGDSAGGNLALALARYIHQNRPMSDQVKYENGAVVDGLILFSPWVDLSLSYFDAGPSSSGVRNKDTDYLSLASISRARDALIEGLPADAASNELLSCLCRTQKPSKDLFDGFPRALIFGGSQETLIDEIRDLHKYYQAASETGKCGQVAYLEEPLGTHDYCALPLGFAPEQTRALEKITVWI